MLDKDIPFKVGYSKVSHPLYIVHLRISVLNHIYLLQEISLMMAERCTDLWIWQYVINLKLHLVVYHFTDVFIKQNNNSRFSFRGHAPSIFRILGSLAVSGMGFNSCI